MRCYTKQHKYYCGIDLHAQSMYLPRSGMANPASVADRFPDRSVLNTGINGTIKVEPPGSSRSGVDGCFGQAETFRDPAGASVTLLSNGAGPSHRLTVSCPS
jgi:hypothetical protein